MIINAPGLEAVKTSFDTLFQNVLKAQKTTVDPFTMTVPSTSDTEAHAWVDEIDELREWIGPRQVQNFSTRLQKLTNKLYERTVGVRRVDIEDDKLGLYNVRFELLARAAALWPDKLVVDALLAGGSTVTYDGQYFFDTDHPQDPDSPTSPVISNLFAGTALTAANFQARRQYFMSIKGRSGVPLGLVPDLIIVPPALESAARQIVQADYINGGDSNTNKGLATVLVLPRLAGNDTTWYLACTGFPIKPLVFQKRMAPEFVAKDDPRDNNVFERDEYHYGVRARGAAGYGLWQLMAKMTA